MDRDAVKVGVPGSLITQLDKKIASQRGRIVRAQRYLDRQRSKECK